MTSSPLTLSIIENIFRTLLSGVFSSSGRSIEFPCSIMTSLLWRHHHYDVSLTTIAYMASTISNISVWVMKPSLSKSYKLKAPKKSDVISSKLMTSSVDVVGYKVWLIKFLKLKKIFSIFFLLIFFLHEFLIRKLLRNGKKISVKKKKFLERNRRINFESSIQSIHRLGHLRSCDLKFKNKFLNWLFSTLASEKLKFNDKNLMTSSAQIASNDIINKSMNKLMTSQFTHNLIFLRYFLVTSQTRPR